MGKEPTIREVAAKAGVSIATVSRVVAGEKNVRPATVARVQEAIQKMGYRPNYNAQALARRTTNTIGVIVDRTPQAGLQNYYFIDMLASLATSLSSHCQDLLLAFTGEEKELEEVQRIVSSQKIDGMIKLSVRDGDQTLEYLKAQKFPTVVIGNAKANPPLFYVDNDNVQAMQDAAKYLVDGGHRKIAFVGGSPQYIVTRDRLKGFLRAIESEKQVEYKIFYAEFRVEDGYRLGQQLLDEGFEAAACTDDLLAMGILEYARENGRKIVVAGFNNVAQQMRCITPFSSVDIQTQALAESAVELLLGAIQGQVRERKRIVPAKFIVRDGLSD